MATQLGHVLTRGRRARSQQAGFSLLEVLVAVMLVGLVVLGLATAFLTMVRTNRMTSEQQRVDHALNDVTETLKATHYVPCTPGAAPAPGERIAPYLAAVPAQINGVRLQLLDVTYRDPSGEVFAPTCPPSGDAGTQLITVHGQFGGRERNAQIVVRAR